MKSMILPVALCLFSGLSAGQNSEKKIQRKDLPAAVQKTVQEQTKGATVLGFAKEVEGGKTFYEAETKVNGRTRDILMDPAGTVVEVEEEVALNDLPAPVKAAFTAAAGTGKILKVEKLTKGTAVSYEAQVNKGGKKSEVQVGPDGKIIP